MRTSVLAVRGVGVQLRSERRSGACCHQAFVPAERIAHAVVNECVEFNDVTTYLALQLRDERCEGVVPAADLLLRTRRHPLPFDVLLVPGIDKVVP